MILLDSETLGCKIVKFKYQVDGFISAIVEDKYPKHHREQVLLPQ